MAGKNVYRPEDTNELDYDRDLGDPGRPPFTRGSRDYTFAQRPWTRRMIVGYGLPQDSNRRLRRLLEMGQDGLIIVPDTPTQVGMDSDHPAAQPDAGRMGVPLSCVEDMSALLDGIPLTGLSLSMQTATSDSSPVGFCQLLVAAERRGIPWTGIRGSLSNSPLMRYFGYDSSLPVELALKVCIDVVEFCVRKRLRFHPLGLGGYVFREAGLSAAEEVAVSIAAGLCYVTASLDRGLDFESFGPRLYNSSAIGSDLFTEVAKLRAERRLWSRIMAERFGAKSAPLTIVGHTSGSSLTAKQPENNIVRAGFQFLAAVLGGCTAIDFSSYDEPLSLPTERAARIALNTQHIGFHETGIAEVADPLGGSYYLEALTDEVEAAAHSVLQEIEALGGLVAAGEQRWVSDLIERNLVRREGEIRDGSRVVVGVNRYQVPPEEEESLELLRLPSDLMERRQEQMAELRRRRDGSAVAGSLAALMEAAPLGRGENLMPFILDAVRAAATLGEINGVIRVANGEPYDRYGLTEPPAGLSMVATSR